MMEPTISEQFQKELQELLDKYSVTIVLDIQVEKHGVLVQARPVLQWVQNRQPVQPEEPEAKVVPLKRRGRQ